MDAYVNLPLTRDEYHTLVRLLGHHTTGKKLDRLYSQLIKLRPMEVTIAENKGPLCSATPSGSRDLYGTRPVVALDNE